MANAQEKEAFGGDVERVTATMKDMGVPNRAAVAAIVEFTSGAVGTLNLGSEGGFGRFCELLERQKEGKKKMKLIGRVEVPGDVFINALKLDD